MKRQRAVITVFFCLLSVIFLAGALVIVEAVRVAGARAHCANASALGLWSVFSEYENILLEDYGLFAVDGSSGSQAVSKDLLLSKYSGYLNENVSSTADISVKLPGLLMDPWRVSVSQAQVRQYEQEKKKAGDSAGQLESEIAASRSQLYGKSSGSTANASSGNVEILAVGEESKKLQKAEEEGRKKNPLEKISSLQKKDLLKLVCGKKKVSGKSLSKGSLLSRRRKNKGVLALDAKRGGTADNLLFREYLLDHFPDCSDDENSKPLSYELEYLIAGKYTDKANLKKVLKRLLFLREGMNYSFLVSNSSFNAQASALAAVVAGWTGKPAVIAAIKHALLLAWAYGESLFDVRILLHGGRVPLKKGKSSWNLPLDRLIDLETELKRADRIAKNNSSSGLSYKDFLRVLIAMTSLSKLKTRSMDLMEQNIRKSDGMTSFRADNCVVGMTVKTDWDIPAVFSRTASALINVKALTFHTSVSGGFAY